MELRLIKLSAIVLAFLAFGLAVTPHQCSAGDYIGIEAGQSWGRVPTSALVMERYELDESFTVGRLAVGHDAGWWGVELGYMPQLSRRTAEAVGTRPAGDFDIHQDIVTRAVDLRGRLGLQLSPKLTASLFAGVAWVQSENHEYGYNTNSHAPTEWRNTMQEFAPLYGVGLRYQVRHGFAITAEIEQVPGVAHSHWTDETDVTVILVGVQVALP